MKTRGEIVSALNEFEVTTQWRQKSQWRRKNHAWLRYSGFIALRVLERLEELDLSQKELAEKMGCSPQYVSKLVKGSENLTLETISKLEECLNLDLIESALTYVSGYQPDDYSDKMVAEPEPPEYGNNPFCKAVDEMKESPIFEKKK